MLESVEEFVDCRCAFIA